MWKKEEKRVERDTREGDRKGERKVCDTVHPLRRSDDPLVDKGIDRVPVGISVEKSSRRLETPDTPCRRSLTWSVLEHSFFLGRKTRVEGGHNFSSPRSLLDKDRHFS